MNKTALITGASSGIGKVLARIHAEKTGDLIIVARRGDKLKELQQELEQKYKRKVVSIVKDLSHPQAAEELYASVKTQGIEVEYLINNAGFGGRGKFHEREWEKDLSMINLNIIALTALTRFFLPDFVERNRGRILNVSSTASLVPGPLQAVYYASKAYVTSFSNALAEELHDTDITVTALLPGATETEFAKNSDMVNTALFDKTQSAEKVALAGYKAMLKGKLNTVAGLGFLQKLLLKMVPFTPKKLLLKQIRKMQEK